jgi:biopolymer transport protein ExbB
MFLLQADSLNGIVPDTVATAATQTAQAVEELRFIDLLIKGGWVMIPLGLLLFFGLIIFIERYITNVTG